MAKHTAICFRCGAWKSAALGECDQCGFKPTTDIDAARSVILGPPYYFNTADEVIETGRNRSELADIAKQIMSGKGYPFSDSEVAAVAEEYRKFKSLRPKDLFISTVKWLLPPVALLALLLIIIWRSRSQ